MPKIVLYFRALDVVRACIAIRPCISNEATRDYLHGVLIDRDPLNPKGAVFVSTNGTTPGLYRCEPLGDGESLVDLFKMPALRETLPTSAVDVLAKIKLPKHDSELTVMRMTFELPETEDGEPVKGSEPAAVLVEIMEGDDKAAQSWRFALLTGNFPDWQRVQPFDLPPVRQAFQTAYVEQLAKAAGAADKVGKLPRAYGMTAMALQLSEDFPTGPARILTDVEGLSYVIMPMRAGAAMEIEEEAEPADWQIMERLALKLRSIRHIGKSSDDIALLNLIETQLQQMAARQPGYTGRTKPADNKAATPL